MNIVEVFENFGNDLSLDMVPCLKGIITTTYTRNIHIDLLLLLHLNLLLYGCQILVLLNLDRLQNRLIISTCFEPSFFGFFQFEQDLSDFPMVLRLDLIFQLISNCIVVHQD